jgi:hypothetical protein
MPALVKADRRQAQRHRCAGKVVVALLARIGSMQNDDAGTRRRLRRGRQPQGVGQTFQDAGVGGEQRVDGARRRNHTLRP